MTASPDKLSYNIGQAVAAIGISRSSLYEEIAAGELWTFKAKGRTLILREVLEAYLARKVEESRAGPD